MYCSARSCGSHRRPSVSSAPSRLLDSSGVFFPAFFFLQSTPHSSKASLAAQHAWHRQVSEIRFLSLSNASRSGGQSSLATNLSRRQALFVQGNYCSSVFWWSARHAFLPKKNRKNPVPTMAQSLVCCMWCVLDILTVCQEFGRPREPVANHSIKVSH